MNTETKIEMLSDVIGDLNELVPMRFGVGSRYPVAFFAYDCWDIKDFDGAMEHMAIRAACEEECEARGWWFDLMSPTHDEIHREAQNDGMRRRADEWYVQLWGPTSRGIRAFAPTAALAIATALRDALKP